MTNTVEQGEVKDGIFQEASFNRYGLMSAILLIVGCLGGVTVGAGAVNDIIPLSLVVISTMTTLSLMLAVAPMNYIFKASIAAISIDILLLIYYIAF